MGGALKSVFNPEISGTGQTAGDLTKLGYSGADLARMDPKRALLAGVVKGGAGAFPQQGQQPGGGGGGLLPPGPGATPVDPSYFAPTNFGQNPWDQRGPKSPLYG